MLLSAIKYIFWGFRVVYLIVLFFRTLISFFFCNRLRIWLILELNFIRFVRILRQELTIINRNGNLYYFLIQRLGRALILLRILVFLVWDIYLFKLVFLAAIMLKLGSAPFQFWYLKLIQKINWNNIWLLSIWQKLIPLILAKFCSGLFLIVFSVLRILIRRVRSIKQKKIKKILGLSSLFSLGWILSVVAISKVWLWFVAGYGIALLNLIYALRKNHLQSVETLENSLRNPHSFLVFFLGLLIMSGIPPFIVFYLKILILFILIKIRFLLVMMFLGLSIFIIYIYLIIGFSLLTFLKLKERSSSYVKKNIFRATNMLSQNLIFTVCLIAFI